MKYNHSVIWKLYFNYFRSVLTINVTMLIFDQLHGLNVFLEDMYTKT